MYNFTSEPEEEKKKITDPGDLANPPGTGADEDDFEENEEDDDDDDLDDDEDEDKS